MKTRGTALEHAAYRLQRARSELNEATKQARSAALEALADGAAESGVARAVGVDRMTVRRWAGKR